MKTRVIRNDLDLLVTRRDLLNIVAGFEGRISALEVTNGLLTRRLKQWEGVTEKDGAVAGVAE